MAAGVVHFGAQDRLALIELERPDMPTPAQRVAAARSLPVDFQTPVLSQK